MSNRLTDHATSEAVGCIYAMHACDVGVSNNERSVVCTVCRPEQWLAEAAGKRAGTIPLSVHAWLDEARVLDQNAELTVSTAEHAAVVDVCRRDHDTAVVDNQHLAVDVDQLRHLMQANAWKLQLVKKAQM